MHSIHDIFKTLGAIISLTEKTGLALHSPGSGETLATLAQDDAKSVDKKIRQAKQVQEKLAALPRRQREHLVETYAAALKKHRESLAEIIHLEGGKTLKEAQAETDAAADMLLKTIKDASLPELNGMLRVKERPPAGVVGLITSFNFPISVAHWTLAPALLAGNAVVWKPSEKTPLTALACKAIFDKALLEYADALQLVIGGREVGEALVAHEAVDVISATGSVAMGEGIKKTLAVKKNNALAPILELGGNNGVIISDNLSPEHLLWSVKSLMNSFLGTTGQRCTNTRRLIVHKSVLDEVVKAFSTHIEAFLKTAVTADGIAANDYGYGPLIDADAFARFEKAKKETVEQGGKVLYGKRLLAEKFPHAYRVEPALAALSKQSAIMQEETFAPILFLAPYDAFDDAIAMLNAPANAGLVSAIYTQSQQKADRFAAKSEAGHVLINPPKGTGTPAHGMGFGGNKASGTGEILNAADPLQPFTRPGKFTRIAVNKEIALSE